MFRKVDSMAMRRSIVQEESGTILILFAFLLIPIIGFAGLAIDTIRANNATLEVGRALDSAALAGGRLLHNDPSDRDAVIEAYFDESLINTRYALYDVELDIQPNLAADTIQLSATAKIRTTLLGVLGPNYGDVTAVSEVMRGDSSLEVALALDVSGSMGGSKIATLRDASKTLVDILYTDGEDEKVQISIVPWNYEVWPYTGLKDPSKFVNTSISLPIPDNTYSYTYNYAPNEYDFHCNDSNGARTIKADKRVYKSVTQYAYNHKLWYLPHGTKLKSDELVVGDLYPVMQMSARTYTHEYYLKGAYQDSCVTSYTYDATSIDPRGILPLRQKPVEIKKFIDDLYAGGGTSSVNGLFWAWRTISPKWRGEWKGVDNSLPKDYSADYNYKAVVLMTDGANFANIGVGNEGSHSVNSDATSKQICTQMKNEDIRVYTIAFGSGSSGAHNYLKHCASTSGHFFYASDNAALVTAFEAIASDLASLQLQK